MRRRLQTPPTAVAARLSLAAVLGALGGCSLLVDTSGLTDGAPSGGGADAGLDAGDDDAAPVGDAVSDARALGPDGSSTEGDGSSSSPCASIHLFCDDFDGVGQKVGDGWDSLVADPGTGLELSTAQPVSFPSALHATMLPQQGTGTHTVGLTKRFEGPWAGISLDFDVDFQATPALSSAYKDVTLAEISLVPGNGAPSLTADLIIASDYADIAVHAPVFDDHFGVPLKLSPRSHLRIEVDPSTFGRVALVADGTKTVESQVTWDTTGATTTGARIDVAIGLGQFRSPTPAFDMTVDNVVVDRLP